MARTKSRYAKPTNSLTFYTCIKCGSQLNTSEAGLSDTCQKCLNPVKTKEKPKVTVFASDKESFLMETKTFSYMGDNYTLNIYADPMFNPVPEILDEQKVCIYYGNSAESDQGEGVYQYLISKQILKPQKNDTEKRRW